MKRISKVERKTKETEVKVNINLDGKGRNKISTTLPFLDHMLELFSFHSGTDLYISAKGDTHIDDHHLVEDIGITLGTAFNKALGDKKGINRYGEVMTPMDESLSYIVLDISGRAYLSYKINFFPEYKKSQFDYSLIHDFFYAFVNNAKVTLHIKMLNGKEARLKNNHHICESVFKGFARAVKQSISTTSKKVPSTKKVI